MKALLNNKFNISIQKKIQTNDWIISTDTLFSGKFNRSLRTILVSDRLGVLLLILGDSGGGSQWAFSTYGLQVLTPDRLRGRIAGIDYSLYFLMNTISTLLIGYLATLYGVLFVFTLFPVLGFIFGFVWYLSTRCIWMYLVRS